MPITVWIATRSCGLADCSSITRNENLLITGSTGIGKGYVATAIGHQACIKGYSVLYTNTPKLFARLKMAKADASYVKEIAKIERQRLLVLDDSLRRTKQGCPDGDHRRPARKSIVDYHFAVARKQMA